jgi:hypothetical protein
VGGAGVRKFLGILLFNGVAVVGVIVTMGSLIALFALVINATNNFWLALAALAVLTTVLISLYQWIVEVDDD